MDVVRHSPRAQRGLTLVELITTTAVLGISLAVIVPSWTSFAQRNQVTATSNLLLAHLRFARTSAVHRRAFVSLCPSNDGSSCSGNPFGWHQGYLIFSDANGNRSRDAGEPLMRVQGEAPPGLRLFSTAGRPAIRFRSDGAAWSTNTTFSICASDDSTANRAVILFGTGRARVDRRAPGNKSVTCL
jgi:type IV fimbrial biogenesis protein FimT